jgi:multicomponent Na+:H+ antiporter subunit G
MREILGSLVVLGGSLFLFTAGLGVLRMPDSYNRIQTGTKASTLGIMLVLIGMSIDHPSWAGKMLILAIFVVITNPVSSHALARAAHRRGIQRARETVLDRLEEKEPPDDTTGADKPAQS